MSARFLFPVAFLFLAPPLFAQVAVRYDPRSDVTTVGFPLVRTANVVTGRELGGRQRHGVGAAVKIPKPVNPPSGPMGLRAWFECAGDRLCVPRTVHMVFATSSPRPKFRTKHEVTLVVDKELEITDIETQYSAQTGPPTPAASRAVMERILCGVQAADFLSLAGGHRVNYKIGSKKGRLSDEQLAALAALAEKIEEAREVEPEP